MSTELEFLDGVDSENIASNMEAYDGHVPGIDDLVYLEKGDNLTPFRVVDRAVYFIGSSAGARQRISLHCELFDKERDAFTH